MQGDRAGAGERRGESDPHRDAEKIHGAVGLGGDDAATAQGGGTGEQEGGEENQTRHFGESWSRVGRAGTEPNPVAEKGSLVKDQRFRRRSAMAR